jgi:hypothetical protein
MGVLTDVFAPGVGLARKKTDSGKRDDSSPSSSGGSGGSGGDGSGGKSSVGEDIDRMLTKRKSQKRS